MLSQGPQGSILPGLARGGLDHGGVICYLSVEVRMSTLLATLSTHYSFSTCSWTPGRKEAADHLLALKEHQFLSALNQLPFIWLFSDLKDTEQKVSEGLDSGGGRYRLEIQSKALGSPALQQLISSWASHKSGSLHALIPAWLLPWQRHLLAMREAGEWGQEKGLLKQNVFSHTHKTTGLLEANTPSRPPPLTLEFVIRSMRLKVGCLNRKGLGEVPSQVLPEQMSCFEWVEVYWSGSELCQVLTLGKRL